MLYHTLGAGAAQLAKYLHWSALYCPPPSRPRKSLLQELLTFERNGPLPLQNAKPTHWPNCMKKTLQEG